MSRESWFEISVEAPAGHPGLEEAERILVEAGARSILEQARDVSVVSSGVERRSTRLVTYLPWSAGVAFEPCEAQLAALVLDARGTVRVTTQLFDRGAVASGWQPVVGAVRASDAVCIHPPWSEPIADCEVAVVIEPGPGFGIGAHPSTLLCIRALERLLRTPHGTASTCRTMLDVGCGSGVLAIVASRLGLREVTGVDVDPIAVLSSLENAARNGVSGLFTTRSVESMASRFDLVMANLRTPTLLDLRGALQARAHRQLTLSGIQQEEVDDVVAAYTNGGAWRCEHRDVLDGWYAVTLTTPLR